MEEDSDDCIQIVAGVDMSCEQTVEYNELSLHSSCPIHRLLKSVPAFQEVVQLYYRCKLCDQAPVHIHLENFLQHLQEYHSPYYSTTTEPTIDDQTSLAYHYEDNNSVDKDDVITVVVSTSQEPVLHDLHQVQISSQDLHEQVTIDELNIASHSPPPVKKQKLDLSTAIVSQIKHTPPPKWCILAVVSRRFSSGLQTLDEHVYDTAVPHSSITPTKTTGNLFPTYEDVEETCPLMQSTEVITSSETSVSSSAFSEIVTQQHQQDQHQYTNYNYTERQPHHLQSVQLSNANLKMTTSSQGYDTDNISIYTDSVYQGQNQSSQAEVCSANQYNYDVTGSESNSINVIVQDVKTHHILPTVCMDSNTTPGSTGGVFQMPLFDNQKRGVNTQQTSMVETNQPEVVKLKDSIKTNISAASVASKHPTTGPRNAQSPIEVIVKIQDDVSIKPFKGNGTVMYKKTEQNVCEKSAALQSCSQDRLTSINSNKHVIIPISTTDTSTAVERGTPPDFTNIEKDRHKWELSDVKPDDLPRRGRPPNWVVHSVSAGKKLDLPFSIGSSPMVGLMHKGPLHHKPEDRVQETLIKCQHTDHSNCAYIVLGVHFHCRACGGIVRKEDIIAHRYYHSSVRLVSEVNVEEIVSNGRFCESFACNSSQNNPVIHMHCLHCEEKTFETGYNFHEHLKNCHPKVWENCQAYDESATDIEQCLLCRAYFTSRESLTKHTTDRHFPKFQIKESQSFAFVCCEEEFLKIEPYKIHMAVQHKTLDPVLFKQSSLTLRCLDCGEEVIGRSHMKKHRWIKHMSDENNFKTCSLCGATFSKSQHLEEHMADKHKNSVNDIQCSDCVKAFPTQALRNKHFTLVHAKKYTYNCYGCAKGFHSEFQFLHHKENKHHNSVSAKDSAQDHLHRCIGCEKPFVFKVSQEKHEKVCLKYISIKCVEESC